jgi:glucose-fructose oxidoreductase
VIQALQRGAWIIGGWGANKNTLSRKESGMAGQSANGRSNKRNGDKNADASSNESESTGSSNGSTSNGSNGSASGRKGSASSGASEASKSAGNKGSQKSRKIRYAVVGLGHIAQAAVLPAFAHAKRNCELAALVSSDKQKLQELGERYDIEALYDYRDLRQCLAEESIDAVYIATPNSEHLPFIRQAAAMGVHVLCEKPLGVTERECLEAIEVCEDAGVHLMTAYRLHFEAANLAAIKMINKEEIGEPRVFSSVFSYQIKDEDNIRLQPRLGGGPLHDIGIYCINAARNLFKAEPIQVHAWTLRSGDPRFEGVDETVTAMLKFPGDRVATFTCSFGIAATGWFQVVGTKGDITLWPAYEYAEGLGMCVTIGEKTREKQYAKRDQFAAELIAFSECIVNNKEPEPSGWEGLADVRVIRALQQSIERGCVLDLPPSPHVRYARPEQQRDLPPVRREPKLVKARSASED